MIRLLVIAALCLLPAKGLALDAMESVCRVSDKGTIGTGIVFLIRDGDYYLLTNAHVVGMARTVHVEFWRRGYQSNKIAGDVIWKSYHRTLYRDMAIVRIARGSFGAGPAPFVTPLGNQSFVLTIGSPVSSVGCANGGWATAWRGHVLGVNGGVVEFTPPPSDGRSGSALLTEDGKTLVGLIAWRAEGGKGIAQSLQEIYRAFQGMPPTTHKTLWTQRAASSGPPKIVLGTPFTPAPVYPYVVQAPGGT